MKYLKWILIGLCILGLIGVRFVESKIFYDPILEFFKTTTHKTFPELEWTNLIISHLIRFGLNLFFSLGIIHFLFKNKKWTLQGGILIILSFVVFFPIYLYCLYTEFKFGELFAFYIRRIVIQPLPLLIIIPIFYYKKIRDF